MENNEIKHNEAFIKDEELLEGGETKSSKILNRVAPTTIALSIVAMLSVGSYFLMDYRISQTDNRLEKILSELIQVKDKKIEVDSKVIKTAINEVLKEMNERVANVENKVKTLETEVVGIKKQTSELNIDELNALKTKLDTHIKYFEENKQAIETLINSVKAGNNSVALPKETKEIEPVIENPVNENAKVAEEVVLPFTIEKILKPNIVNVRINGQLYSIDINKAVIMNRYEIRLVDMSKNTVVVYDMETNQYQSQTAKK